MPKINWKTILNENLLILAYPFDSNVDSAQTDLFHFENNKLLQDILNFLLLKVDPETHDELSKLLPNTTDRKNRITYLRQLFNWCIGVITETFTDFKCNSALFISPKGPQINEFLGRLTTCVLIKDIKKIQKNRKSSSVRPRIILSDLQSTRKCFPEIISTANEEFIRETSTYLEHLNMLLTRKEAVENELKFREQSRLNLLQTIANLKADINFNGRIDKMDEIDEDSVSLYDADISQRLDEVNSRFNKLTSILEQITTVCGMIHTSYVNKSDDVNIDISSFTNNENNSLLIENEEINLGRLFAKLKMDLKFNKEHFDKFAIRNEENRVKNGIERIESSLSQNLINASRTKENLMDLKNKIVVKRNNVENNSKNLQKFMPFPNLKSFVSDYGEEIDNSSISNSEEDLIEPSNNDEKSTKDVDNSIKKVNRNSKEIIESIEEEINIIDNFKSQVKTNDEKYLRSQSVEDLHTASGNISPQEDSRKSKMTYNAPHSSIRLQKLPQDTINRFLNWPPESDLTRDFTDSDFLYQSDPNDSFFSSPPTKHRMNGDVFRAKERLKNLENRKSDFSSSFENDDEFELK